MTPDRNFIDMMASLARFCDEHDIDSSKLKVVVRTRGDHGAFARIVKAISDGFDYSGPRRASAPHKPNTSGKCYGIDFEITSL